MDETGLFYRLQADHSLATKQLEGKKKSKERLTRLCAPMETEVINYSLDHREVPESKMLQECEHNMLGCVYRHNTKAWMLSTKIYDYLKWF